MTFEFRDKLIKGRRRNNIDSDTFTSRAQIIMADDENRRETSRLWRVYKTSKQMCYDRVSRNILSFH